MTAGVVCAVRRREPWACMCIAERAEFVFFEREPELAEHPRAAEVQAVEVGESSVCLVGDDGWRERDAAGEYTGEPLGELCVSQHAAHQIGSAERGR